MCLTSYSFKHYEACNLVDDVLKGELSLYRTWSWPERFPAPFPSVISRPISTIQCLPIDKSIYDYTPISMGIDGFETVKIDRKKNYRSLFHSVQKKLIKQHRFPFIKLQHKQNDNIIHIEQIFHIKFQLSFWTPS